eukprot:TRINITY_DN3123_c0_g1_i1.p1 TRINITY_DN3123_c0_g1~~TRINITY_DN3123_c0_g1_i1.p1  ORF type:complete len:329 (-),score=50.21 TRINITY_DN3123_c0_g1_i1:613-1542(-)
MQNNDQNVNSPSNPKRKLDVLDETQLSTPILKYSQAILKPLSVILDPLTSQEDNTFSSPPKKIRYETSITPGISPMNHDPPTSFYPELDFFEDQTYSPIIQRIPGRSGFNFLTMASPISHTSLGVLPSSPPSFEKQEIDVQWVDLGEEENIVYKHQLKIVQEKIENYLENYATKASQKSQRLVEMNEWIDSLRQICDHFYLFFLARDLSCDSFVCALNTILKHQISKKVPKTNMQEERPLTLTNFKIDSHLWPQNTRRCTVCLVRLSMPPPPLSCGHVFCDEVFFRFRVFHLFIEVSLSVGTLSEKNHA